MRYDFLKVLKLFFMISNLRWKKVLGGLNDFYGYRDERNKKITSLVNGIRVILIFLDLNEEYFVDRD